MALTPGTKLGPYEIQSAVGAGGMGEVYRAWDTRLDRVVAIKVLASHLSSSAEPPLMASFLKRSQEHADSASCSLSIGLCECQQPHQFADLDALQRTHRIFYFLA
jgi:serine/threonine protein kinase